MFSLNAQLIEAQQLNHQLQTEQTPKVIILDCRFDLQNANAGKAAFEEAHIPNAVYIDLEKDLSGEVTFNGGRHPLPNLSKLANKLANIGINTKTQVILYDDQRGAYACRAWWLLNHIGVSQCQVLNGGFSAWKAQGLPCESGYRGMTNDAPPASWFQKGDERLPTSNFNQLANGSQRNNRLICDAREAKRYRGEQEPIDPVAGHIPGAVNAPWQANTDEKGFFKSPSQLKQQWMPLLKNDNAEASSQEIIHYCGSGVTACVNIFSSVLAGFKTPTLYPGSWSDWCSHFDQ